MPTKWRIPHPHNAHTHTAQLSTHGITMDGWEKNGQTQMHTRAKDQITFGNRCKQRKHLDSSVP